jgi:hypothetical protein
MVPRPCCGVGLLRRKRVFRTHAPPTQQTEERKGVTLVGSFVDAPSQVSDGRHGTRAGGWTLQ